MPKPPLERPDASPWPTHPLVLKETHAHQEGGKRLWSVTTKAFTGKNNAVEKMSCAEVEWEQEGNRLRGFVEKKASDFELKADLVILAMGFTGPGRNKIVDTLNLERDERSNIKADQNHMTNKKRVFTAGDMNTGQSLVVWAIDSGQQAASGIVNYLETL
ncbi:MAG: FAD-dependent oxidoreductase [Thermodesulfobacteriota bacterium]|nr:FAD-dependent oxidoreductase [Thermodesulfobacteriota bacterium]